MTGAARVIAETAATVLAGLAGGAAFAALGLPVPWLSGAMVAVAGLAMAGAPVRVPDMLRDFAFLIAGVSLGSTVTPEALATIARYPWSLIGLSLTIVLTVAVSKTLLERCFGWDTPTAFLAAVPGALSMVMALAAQSAGDVRRIAVTQAVRLFALVTLMPLAINATGASHPMPAHPMVGAPGMAALFAATFIVAAVMGRFGFANPLFLGGLVASTALHMVDLVPGELPAPLTGAGMLLIGVFSGLRFQGATPRYVLGIFWPALIVLAVALAISGAGAVIVHLATGLRLPEVLVAFAPGGVEAMILMGAAMGLDTLYISVHHVLRTVALNAVTPFFAPKQPAPKDR